MGWKRGDLIMKSEPYAHVLSQRHRLKRCSYCLHLQECIKKCTGCSVIRYCGRDCQRRDWSLHKVECKSLQKVSPMVPTDSVLLMLRLVIRYLNGDHIRPTEPQGNPPTQTQTQRTFQQLMSHSEEIRADEDRGKILGQVCSTLTMLSGPFLQQLPPPSLLLDIFGKMVINTFTIFNQELEDIGAGVYLSQACLDHRCSPNAVGSFNGKTLMLRAIEDIPDGDPLTVQDSVFLSYVDQMAPSWERQEQLQKQYYFWCQCPRCCDVSLDKAMTAETSTAQAESDCRVASDDDIDVVKSAAMKSTAIRACQAAIDKVDHLKKTEGTPEEILSLCRDCLSRVRSSLSPSNVYLVRLLDRAFDAAISAALWEEALGYGLQTLKPYRLFLHAYNPHLGLQLLRVAKLQLWLGQDWEARAHLVQAERIVTVTHGQDSQLYTQLRELLSQCSQHHHHRDDDDDS